MAGPTCEAELLAPADEDALTMIDAILASIAKPLIRTRKGRVWDVWVGGRPVHVVVLDSTPRVELSAGCNSPDDYAALRRLGCELAAALGGVASEPVK